MAGTSRKLFPLSNGVKIQILQVFLCCMIGVLVLANYLFGKEMDQKLWKGSLLVNRLDAIASLNTEIKNIQIDVIQVQQYLSDVSATRALDGLDDGFDLADKSAKSFEQRARASSKSASELKLPQISEAIKEALQQFPAYREVGRKMAEAYVTQGPAGGNKMMADFDAKAEQLGEAMGKLTHIAADQARAASQEAAALQSSNSRFQAISLIIGLLALAAGAAAALYTFVLDRRAKAQEKQAAILIEKQAEGERRKAESSIAIINSLGQGLAELAKGDLTHAIETPFPEGFEPLREHFNATRESLKLTIESVKDGSARILRGVSEIATASDDLSRRTESQAASLEQTSAAVAEISVAVKKNAESSDEARAAAIAAMQEAAASSAVVLKAVTAMHEIKQSSGKIQQIIGVIDEIAFQTNLLALNAGVEAARAGDAGRGFAVVAAEVRALSDRSAEAARDIKSLLDVSSGQVEGGVELVGRAGNALKSISDRITSISNIIGVLSSSAQQQASGLHEVTQAVEQMDKVTQQNAAMVEETNAATRALADQTDELAGLIASFRTEEAMQAA